MPKAQFVATILIVTAITAPVAIRSFQSESKFVTGQTLTERLLKPSVLASGVFKHEVEAHLTTEVVGTVQEIFVSEGDRVNAGDLVLKLDDKEFSSSKTEREAEVRLAEIELRRKRLEIDDYKKRVDRSLHLHETGLSSIEVYEKEVLNLQLATIDLELARESLVQKEARLEQSIDRLNKTKVFSPIDGIVTSLEIRVGETAVPSSTNIPGSSLMTISEPTSLYVEVEIDENDYSKVNMGQLAEIGIPGYKDSISGRVRSLAERASKSTNFQSRIFRTKVSLLEYDSMFKSGMSARVQIYTGGNKNSLTLPIEAVQIGRDERRNGFFVFVVEQGIVKLVEVVVGRSDDQYTEILSGLEVSEVVVTGPSRTLRHLVEGDAVEVSMP